MIAPPVAAYERPALPSEDDLAPERASAQPPTPCEQALAFLHQYHRVFATVMFLLCIALLLWGGLHGINVGSRIKPKRDASPCRAAKRISR